MLKRLFDGLGMFGQSGSNTYTGTDISSVTASGSTKIIKAEVSGATTVSGSTKVESSTLNALRASGSTVINDSHVQGEINLSGSFHSINSTYDESMRLGVDSGTFEACTMQNIEVIQTSASKAGGVQRLHFQGKSTVHGDIRFEDQHGEVLLSKDSIIHGNVLGGIVRSSMENHL